MASPLISSVSYARRAVPLWKSSSHMLLRALHGHPALYEHSSRLRTRSATAIFNFSTARAFHSSSYCSNKKALEEEKKNLENLTKEFKNGSYNEKVKLAPKLKEQEQKFLKNCLQHHQQAFELKPIPISDSLSLTSVDRTERLAQYIASRYSDDVHWGLEITQLSLIDEITTDFNSQNSVFHPATNEEVLAYLIAYFRLVNGLSNLDDVEFLDELVQDLYDTFIARGLSAEFFGKFDLDPLVLSRWVKVFEIIDQVPDKAENRELTKLCELLAKLSEPILQSNKTEKEQLSAKTSSNDNNKKTDSSEKKNDSKSDFKAYKFFEFTLTPKMMQFFLLGLIGALLMVLLYSGGDLNHEITFQEFSANFLRQNLVAKIRVINNRTAILELNENGRSRYPGPGEYYFAIGSVETFERNLKAVQKDYNIPEQVRVPVVYISEGSMAKFLVNFLPTLLFLGAIYYMTKKASMGGMGGPMSFGKSTAKKFNQETNVKTKFKDVAGMDEAKVEVMEFVKFLQDPGKYEKLGAKIPRGAILSGPPGTGKTLIARATAGEAGVPFYSVSGSEFVEMFVGVGASRVRDLFKTARENAPSIVFVDEIDAIGKQRSKGKASGANDERETTLNQLLVEMDGFDTSDHVVVLAGTNRPDILDKALLRPGRFDRHISIDNPELEGRKDIFKVHLKKITLVDNIDKDLAGRLATLTPGFSGADIANVCNEAALIAARFNAKAVTLRHFELAIERVIGGVEKKSKLLSPDEKRVVAYHEAGHAVCGWFLEHAVPLLKVSIIPRGSGVLGYAQYLPADQYLMSTFDLYDRMVMTLGGRVSEELNFAQVTGGAHDDFKKVTNIAQSMVLRFGMSSKVGMVNYADTQSQDSLAKPFSDETNQIIDSEVKRIVQDCHDRCTKLLTEKSKEVELVAQELLKKEFITREDMIRLLGKRPFPEKNDAFDKYLAGNDAFKNEQPNEEKRDSENSEKKD